MSKLKIDRVELTAFEIEIKNVEENKSGIGIIYKPGSKNKHLRFGIKIFDNGCLTLIFSFARSDSVNDEIV